MTTERRSNRHTFPPPFVFYVGITLMIPVLRVRLCTRFQQRAEHITEHDAGETRVQ
jgi:hypothetical protein